MSIELLDINHRDAIIDAFYKSKRQIRIISPFIQESMSRYLVDSMCRSISSQLITRFYREDFICSVSSLTALKTLQSAEVEIYALKDLHAKLYLFDDNIAIIGSANFTGGGFGNNIELSLYIEDEYDLIERFSKYFDQLISDIRASGDFKITEDKINEEILIVQKAIKGRDHTSKSNPTRFGADIKTSPPAETATTDELCRRPQPGVHRIQCGGGHGADVPGIVETGKNPRLAEAAHLSADRQYLSGAVRRRR